MHCLPGRSQNGYRFKMTYKSLTAVKKYLMRSKLYRLYFTILVLFLNPTAQSRDIGVGVSMSVFLSFLSAGMYRSDKVTWRWLMS